MPLHTHSSFRAKARNLFRSRSRKDVRGTASGKHRTPSAPQKTVFHADRSTQEKEHGKRKRSLGCARDDDTRIPLPARFLSRCDANLRPFGAPPSMGRRENGTSRAPHEDGFRYENAASPHSSFRAKARHLFRSREDKGCERNGKRETPCSLRPEKTVFHADRSTQEKEHGKRKRSLGCARDDDTRILSSKKRRQSRHLNPEP